MVYTFDDNELGVIETISFMPTKLIDEQLTAMCHRFSSDYTHSVLVITEHFIDDVEVHSWFWFDLFDFFIIPCFEGLV